MQSLGPVPVQAVLVHKLVTAVLRGSLGPRFARTRVSQSGDVEAAQNDQKQIKKFQKEKNFFSIFQ